jgi:RNA polymerase sigma-70 factor, ECF subfamily
MAPEPEGDAPTLERFRAYLALFARLHWDPRLKGKYDPSDLVQQTLLEAYEKHAQFRGSGDDELAGWLRQILAHNLADVLRALGQAKRDVHLERSIEAALGESSSRLDGWLAAEQSSPSQRAMRHEELLRLADALDQLPALQRQAVALHHLQGMSLGDLASHLERSEASVAGLLRRGLARLRGLLQEPSATRD